MEQILLMQRTEKIQEIPEVKIQRPQCVKLTAEESFRQMEALPEREAKRIKEVRETLTKGTSDSDDDRP